MVERAEDRTARRWSGETLARLDRLEPASRAALEAIVQPLRLSDNHLRGVLDLVEDTAARCSTSVAEVLGDAEVAALCERPIARSEKIKALKARLRRLRYPQLSAALTRVDELRNALELPGRVRLEVPDNLEGDDVVVTLRASSADEMRAHSERLAAAMAGGEIESIFTILEEAGE